MGLLKRFFSIGSRKSKKRSATGPCTEALPPVQEHLKPYHDDGVEAEVCRLLRSSSGRCVPESQVGSLPPLPHPIDSVGSHPKSSSTTVASVSARSTYSVTIHSRTVLSRTEFPNAYPPMDVTFTPKRSLTDSARRRSKSVPITPRDKNRLLLLRQDPSVASLLNHYDNEGHLNSTLFSNTPSPRKEGWVQRRRTGSTLRQLLGHPSSPDLRSAEGDISWAERFLGETDDNSSVSSIGPLTPVDTHFTHTRSIDDKTVPSIECDTSAANHHTFSSLEVELSISTDHIHPQALDLPNGNSTTPQRASQIFDFLSDKKRARDGPVSGLPQPKTTTPNYRRFSAESSISDTRHSQIPLPRRSNTYAFQPLSPTSPRCFSPASDTSRSPPSPIAAEFLPPQLEHEVSISPQAVTSQPADQSSRCPRGPRLPSKIPARQSLGTLSTSCDFDESHLLMQRPVAVPPVMGEKSNSKEKHMVVAVARSREVHSQIPKLRTASGSSSSSAGSKYEPGINCPRPRPIALDSLVQESEATEATPAMENTTHGKEKDGLSRLPQPVTPIRPFGLHSHHLRELPSPASSSELSPVAKQMMANVREQRMHARQRERQAGRLGSSQSRIRY